MDCFVLIFPGGLPVFRCTATAEETQWRWTQPSHRRAMIDEAAGI